MTLVVPENGKCLWWIRFIRFPTVMVTNATTTLEIRDLIVKDFDHL